MFLLIAFKLWNQNAFIIIIAAYLLLTAACNSGSSKADEKVSISPETVQAVQVAVTEVSEQKDIVLTYAASGKIVAGLETQLSIGEGGVISRAPQGEGQHVTKGDILASVEDTLIQLSLEQAQLELDKAEVAKKDLLISNGGEADADSSVSPSKLKLILTLSGYNQAKHAIKQASYRLSQSKVRAPFSGKIGAVYVRPFERVKPGARVCMLYDPASLQVQFQLLENEAVDISVGQGISLKLPAAPNLTLKGSVTSIAPFVNEQGLVEVKASIDAPLNSPVELILGMNADVFIERVITNQIVIPKKAVVLRSGRPVVFRYHGATKQAKWQYITVAKENQRELAIADGVRIGDTLIIDGHLNLDHDASVRVDTFIK